MKLLTITFLSILSISFASAQNIRFEIKCADATGVSKDKLSAANSIFDLRPGYALPINEIFTTSQIVVTSHGVSRKAKGINEKLNDQQKQLLRDADVGSQIEIEMGFIHQDQVTLFTNLQEINFKVAVVEEVDALYQGDNEELTKYFQSTAISQIPDKFWKTNRNVVIRFTVNENGEIKDVLLVESAKDTAIDALLLKAISNMPKWNPAKNAKGIAAKQQLEFLLGNGC